MATVPDLAAIRAAAAQLFPLLLLVGSQGTGKSQRARIIRWLLDPNLVALRSPPREPRDLAIAATN